ncbi:transketolase C-terminal domain-containing protein, partial [Kingella kingae]
GATVERDLQTVPVGKGIVRKQGEKAAILAFGSMVQAALGVADALNATVADMRFVKPLDVDLIGQLVQSHDYLVCVEENAEMGGAGSAVLEVLAQNGWYKPTLLCAIPDIVTEHGDSHILLDQMGLSQSSLQQRISDWLNVQAA